MVKALALFSGGLDSLLAIKLIQKQGIDVTALNFTSPFCTCNKTNGCGAVKLSKELNIPLKLIDKGKEYLKVIRNPKHGYGKNINPCIDCRIFILKKAKQYAKKIKADFIFTGEVLNERPMSQHESALFLIEKEAGLKRQILRPLSAKLLPETEAERDGLVDREKLLAIRGRCRDKQLDLVKRFHIKKFACPAGGCLLTQSDFTVKLIDLFKHKKTISTEDINLLKIGRHFRINGIKVIVGRNEQENKQLKKFAKKSDLLLEAVDVPTPTALIKGKANKDIIRRAAELTAYYSDSEHELTKIKYKRKFLLANKIKEREINNYKITTENSVMSIQKQKN